MRGMNIIVAMGLVILLCLACSPVLANESGVVNGTAGSKNIAGVINVEVVSGPPGAPEIPPFLNDLDPGNQSDLGDLHDPIKEGLSVPAPVANFVGTPTSGTTPLPVQFTDSSSNTPTGWAWFFGDETYTASWTLMTASAGWEARSQHTSVAMPDGSIVLMGGYHDGGGGGDSEVWRSTDNGAMWTLMTASAGWGQRFASSSVAMPDGSIILMGGYTGNNRNDVWRSTDNGATWTQMTANAGWSARRSHSSVAMPDGSIVLMGGRDGKNDVWRSTDNGATWTQITASAGWTGRQWHSSIAMPDGSIVLMGGVDNNNGSDRNDVWRLVPTGSPLQNPLHTYTTAGSHQVALQAYNAVGYTSTRKMGYITVTPLPPVANFAGTPTSGTSPLTVTFTDNSTNMPTSWSWSFGDGSSVNATQRNPVHTYANAGTYTVSLTATNDGGSNTKTSANYITVNVPAPVANFAGTPTSGAVPLTVTFTDSSTNTPTSWNWSFGDGSSVNATMQNPVHTYASTGTYTVALTATNSAGSNTFTRTSYITVTSAVVTPVANFVGTPTSGTAPLTVTFTDSSTNTPTSWSWSFGDGSAVNATQQNPVHAFASNGTYTVALTATNSAGSNTFTRTSYITVNGAFNGVFYRNGADPIVYGLSTDTPVVGDWNGDGISEVGVYRGGVFYRNGADPIVYGLPNDTPIIGDWNGDGISEVGFFRGGVFYRNGADPIVYGLPNDTPIIGDWNGDGISEVGFFRGCVFYRNGADPIVLGLPTDTPIIGDWNGDHISEVGVFRYGVFYFNGDGYMVFGLPTDTPIIGDWNGDGISEVGSFGSVVSFTGSPTSGTTPLTVTFTSNSINTPTSWSWSFGDGSFSTEKNPSHTYTSAGSYTVALTATTSLGSNTLTKTNYITVSSAVVAPVANFTGTPTFGTAPLTVTFTDTSTGSPTSWNWYFGDGVYSTEKNPRHIYQLSVASTYTVSLTATNAAGSNKKTSANYITVIAPPATSFAGTPTSGAAPLTVTFTDRSINTPTSWNWSFGDGSSVNATVKNPVHTYAVNGTYTVSLTATNAAGSNTKTSANYITVNIPAPVANFVGTPTSGIKPLTVTFTDNSTNTPTSWRWSFGDGSSSTSQNPWHLYSVAGTYTVSLTATNAGGSNTKTSANYITVNNPAPVANFVGTPTSGTTPLTVTFADTSTGSPTSWNWNFGDGGYSTEKSPWHIYSVAGTYTVSLTATNAGGSNTKTSANYITVIAPNVAYFVGTPTSGTAPLTVTFTDNSTNTPTSWIWSFGDGSSGTSQNPSHIYTNTGTYTVSLNASNSADSNTLTRTNYITVSSPFATSNLSFQPGTATVAVNSTTTYAIKLDKAAKGLSGYNITIALSTPSLGKITGVTYPSWASMTVNSTMPAGSAWFKAVDLTGVSGTTNITLCTIGVTHNRLKKN